MSKVLCELSSKESDGENLPNAGHHQSSQNVEREERRGCTPLALDECSRLLMVGCCGVGGGLEPSDQLGWYPAYKAK